MQKESVMTPNRHVTSFLGTCQIPREGAMKLFLQSNHPLRGPHRSQGAAQHISPPPKHYQNCKYSIKGALSEQEVQSSQTLVITSPASEDGRKSRRKIRNKKHKRRTQSKWQDLMVWQTAHRHSIWDITRKNTTKPSNYTGKILVSWPRKYCNLLELVWFSE